MGKDPIFKDLSGEPDNLPLDVESLCALCGENGRTKLLLTRIPHYGDVVIASFSCEACGITNNEIQPGGKIAEKQGVKYRLTVSSQEDLSRQVIKSDWVRVEIPEVELVIPSQSQKGQITTIEGILQRTSEGLLSEQPVRRIMDPQNADKIDKFLEKLDDLTKVSAPWTFNLRDITGLSYIENPLAPRSDPNMTLSHFCRSKEEDESLGIYSSEEEDVKNEVLSFPTNCPSCNSPTSTNMKVTDIPHFKEVVIMATACDYCGYKTNEVKSGGGIESMGKKIKLESKELIDLSRDLLKSETCSISIPELDFEMTGFSLGGKFTTLEGLLTNIQEQISSNPLLSGVIAGDTGRQDVTSKFQEFIHRMEGLKECKETFTIILDDPAGNSYIQNIYAPEEDPRLTIENYERSFEQNESLGLNDMKVENYGEENTLFDPAKEKLSTHLEENNESLLGETSSGGQ